MREARFPSNYPLDEWLRLCLQKNKTLVATQGEDFEVTPERFRTTLHNYAKKRGIKVRTRIIEGSVKFQFYKPVQ